MRVGIFDPYLDDLGGGEKYMISIASCLANKHEVTIFWDKEEDLRILAKRFSFDLAPFNITKNIFSPKVNFFSKLIETSKFDAIIVLSDGSIPLTLSKKLFIHIQQPLKMQMKFFKNRIKISRVNKFFCNSDYTKKFLSNELDSKTIVIYPPVDLYSKDLKKENIILHVGRFRVQNVGLSNYKKQDVMIREFKKMTDNGLKNWTFVLALSIKEGDQKSFDNLRREAEDYPVKFLVNKDNKELWEAYNKAKIYWHASGFGENLIEHPEYAEHFGISTVEAMGAGAVPVVINAGGQKEIVRDGRDGYLWNTLNELAQRTLKLIKDQNTWKRMSDESRKRAENFAGERFCKEISSLIEQ